MKRTGIHHPRWAALGAAAVTLLLGCAPGPSTEPTPAYAAHGAAQERGAVTSANNVVAKDMRRDARFEDVFRGLPGVYVTGSGARASVRVRGPGMRSGEPLFVVDGVALPQGSQVASTLIVPASVARVEVLRDVASTSVWGQRGASGVILVTTKRRR